VAPAHSRDAWFGPDDRNGCRPFGLDASQRPEERLVYPRTACAPYAGIAALLGFVIMLFVTIGDFIADPRIAARHLATT
jgi:hypothetical protein